MPSFDVVSKADMQEVKNAVEQSIKEITQRYDFRGSKSTIELKENLIIVVADDKMKLAAMQEIIKLKLSKRGVSLKSVEFKDETKAGGDTLRQEVEVKQGLKDEELKTLNKLLKAQGLKVTSQIQGDQLRVQGKKRDDLQTTMAYFKANVKDFDLQFINFRE